MQTAFSLFWLLLMLGFLIVVAMYFMELLNFFRILDREHPEILRLARAGGLRPLSDLELAYQVLRKVKAKSVDGQALSMNALDSYAYANRLLYIGVSFFLLFVLLTLLFV